MIIQSFEQSNLRYLNRITPVKLSQLVDAWDVNLDGSLQYAETSLRPYDWTVSGDPRAHRPHVRLPDHERRASTRSAKYADIVAPWKPYIVPTTGTDANGDGAADDVTGDGKVDERDRELNAARRRSSAAPTSAGSRSTPGRSATSPQYLASDYAGDPKEEYKLFYALGIDGLFSDFPDTALAARDEFFEED